jgi:hypothetical protein
MPDHAVLAGFDLDDELAQIVQTSLANGHDSSPEVLQRVRDIISFNQNRDTETHIQKQLDAIDNSDWSAKIKQTCRRLFREYRSAFNVGYSTTPMSVVPSPDQTVPGVQAARPQRRGQPSEKAALSTWSSILTLLAFGVITFAHHSVLPGACPAFMVGQDHNRLVVDTSQHKRMTQPTNDQPITAESLIKTLMGKRQ